MTERGPAAPWKVSEVAAAANCSTRYVQKLIEAGVLPAGRVGKQYRVPAPAVEKLLREAGATS